MEFITYALNLPKKIHIENRTYLPNLKRRRVYFWAINEMNTEEHY